MKEMSNENEDIFKEAARVSLEQEMEAKEKQDEEDIEIIEEENQASLAIAHSMEGDKWDNLTNYINGDGAKRLLQELQNMPSRDYVRNYLKLLEYFKPKLVRSDLNPAGEVDRTIEVELVQVLPSGEKRTININKRNNDG